MDSNATINYQPKNYSSQWFYPHNLNYKKFDEFSCVAQLYCYKHKLEWLFLLTSPSSAIYWIQKAELHSNNKFQRARGGGAEGRLREGLAKQETNSIFQIQNFELWSALNVLAIRSYRTNGLILPASTARLGGKVDLPVAHLNMMKKMTEEEIEPATWQVQQKLGRSSSSTLL